MYPFSKRLGMSCLLLSGRQWYCVPLLNGYSCSWLLSIKTALRCSMHGQTCGILNVFVYHIGITDIHSDVGIIMRQIGHLSLGTISSVGMSVRSLLCRCVVTAIIFICQCFIHHFLFVIICRSWCPGVNRVTVDHLQNDYSLRIDSRLFLTNCFNRRTTRCDLLWFNWISKTVHVMP